VFDDPSHRRIMAKTFGVVDILVSRKSPEDRLPQHTGKRVPAIHSGTRICELLARHRTAVDRLVEFT
jgi:hypothetical protein